MSVNALRMRAAGVQQLLIVVVVTTVLGAFGAGTASAALTSDPAGPDGAKVAEAQMVLDCTDMTKSVHQYAVKHGYCPSTDTESGDVGTNGTVTGNCGTSSIWVDDAPGLGTASIMYGFNSSAGPVAHRNLSIGWATSDRDAGGWPDNSFMFSSSYYAANRVSTWDVITYMSAYLGGSVTLSWGGVCSINGPSSGSYIN